MKLRSTIVVIMLCLILLASVADRVHPADVLFSIAVAAGIFYGARRR